MQNHTSLYSALRHRGIKEVLSVRKCGVKRLRLAGYLDLVCLVAIVARCSLAPCGRLISGKIAQKQTKNGHEALCYRVLRQAAREWKSCCDCGCARYRCGRSSGRDTMSAIHSEVTLTLPLPNVWQRTVLTEVLWGQSILGGLPRVPICGISTRNLRETGLGLT